MSEPICPRVGTECLKHGCLFYDKIPATGDYVCRDALTNLYLNDVAQYLSLLLKSGEQHRALDEQTVKSQVLRQPTEELKRLVGVKDG